MAAVTEAPGTDLLLRRAARIAFRYKAELEVVHVMVDDTGLSRDRRSIDELRELASDLGACWHEIQQGDPARAIVGFARQHEITQIVIGPIHRSWWHIAVRGPIVRRIIEEMDQQAFQGQVKNLLGAYRRTLETDRRYLLEQFEFADMARKVVGVGSVGTRCWIILLLGRDESDPLFLQIKEAEASVLSRFVGASKYTNQGQRVVAGQRLMQAASDIFLGWQRTEAGLDGKQRDFYVRQLRDWKFSMPIEIMVPRGMRIYGQMCGWTLARAHARSGDRIAIAAYLGGADVFDQAITRFAAAYADQNERDHRSLVDAVAAGRITAGPDL